MKKCQYPFAYFIHFLHFPDKIFISDPRFYWKVININTYVYYTQEGDHMLKWKELVALIIWHAKGHINIMYIILNVIHTYIIMFICNIQRKKIFFAEFRFYFPTNMYLLVYCIYIQTKYYILIVCFIFYGLLKF